MTRSPKPPAERRADDILDAYLSERFGIGLETVLLDIVCGYKTPQVACVVSSEVTNCSPWPHSDGGLDEMFDGTLSLEGITYRFRCSAYSIPSAYVGRFLTDIAEFEPVEWQAAARLMARA